MFSLCPLFLEIDMNCVPFYQHLLFRKSFSGNPLYDRVSPGLFHSLRVVKVMMFRLERSKPNAG